MHGGAADRISGVDDDGELGLWDAVVDYLGSVQSADVCITDKISVCGRSIVGCEDLRLQMQRDVLLGDGYA